MTISHSSLPFLNDRPSLCSYCLQPVKGLLFHHGSRWYGACSADHLEKIKLELQTHDAFKQGVREITLQHPIINHTAVEKAVTATKEVYLKAAKRNKSYILHEWQKDDRVSLFQQAIQEYLKYCTAQAQHGLLVKDDG